MALHKTHIVLEPNIGKDVEAREATLKKIAEIAQISQINQKRLERYGIISGLIDDSLLDDIRQIPGVLNVEIDKERSLR